VDQLGRAVKILNSQIYHKKGYYHFLRAPQQMLRTHRCLEGLLCNPVMKMKFFSALPF
jgi:hypothetical protein